MSITWHDPEESLPHIGQHIILEVEGRAGRTNAVGHGVYQGGGDWYFNGDDRVGAWEGLFATDRIVRWAHYPEPSWKEPL